MSRRTPEGAATDWLREVLKLHGVWTLKLSDNFTRGVPDLLAAGGRLVLAEIKVATPFRTSPDTTELTYSQLGLSGPQDHTIRSVYTRAPGSAAVITVIKNESLPTRLWVPINPEVETTDGTYSAVCSGIRAIARWFKLREADFK